MSRSASARAKGHVFDMFVMSHLRLLSDSIELTVEHRGPPPLVSVGVPLNDPEWPRERGYLIPVLPTHNPPDEDR